MADAPLARSELGPCRAWAAGWLHSDPIGQSGLQSRIENRRFLKERNLLREILTLRGAGELVAPAGFAPASSGLKARGPRLLDDEATKNRNAAGIAV